MTMRGLRERAGRAWARWVAIWDLREAPTSLALARIGLGVVLLCDLTIAGANHVVGALWAPYSDGGMGFAAEQTPVPEAFRLFGASASTAHVLYAAVCTAAVLFTAGALTRVAAIVLLLAYAQLAMILPEADRGIDVLFRHALVLFICSGAGATWSLDARLRHGRWSRPDALVPAWPRRLLFLQLVWMYFSAAMHKLQSPWTPLGGFSALYYTLRDPHFARFDFHWLGSVYLLTQVATCATVLFEWSAPLFLVATWAERTRRGGRLGALLRLTRFRRIWLATGLGFHVMLALTMRLGIFPYGVLALYPAFFHPTELASGWLRLTEIARHARKTGFR